MEERHGKETTQAAVHCVIVVLMYSNVKTNLCHFGLNVPVCVNQNK